MDLMFFILEAILYLFLKMFWKNINPTILFPIMIHEWWHVLAEFNPVLKGIVFTRFLVLNDMV